MDCQGKTPEIKAMISSLAEQGMKVAVIMVMRRSRSFSIVRLDMMAGTPHPVAINMGIKDFPDKPKRLKIRSMTKAIRLMYPISSKTPRQTKSTKICGKSQEPFPLQR